MKFKGIEFKAGMPISTPGFAEMIAGMKVALENLSVHNGRVSWSTDGKPKIILNAVTGGGARPVRLVATNDGEGATDEAGEPMLDADDVPIPANGDAENPPRLLYDVFTMGADVEEDDPLLTGISPVLAPHEFRRPAVGVAVAATFGYIHGVPKYYPYFEDDETESTLALGWINEVMDTEACEAPTEEEDA